MSATCSLTSWETNIPSPPTGFSYFQQKFATHQASSAVSRTVCIFVLAMTGCQQVLLRLPEYGVYRHVASLHA